MRAGRIPLRTGNKTALPTDAGHRRTLRRISGSAQVWERDCDLSERTQDN